MSGRSAEATPSLYVLGKLVASSLGSRSNQRQQQQISLMSITASYVARVCGRFYWSTGDSRWQEAPWLHPPTHTHSSQKRNKTVKLSEELFFSAQKRRLRCLHRSLNLVFWTPNRSVSHWRSSLLQWPLKSITPAMKLLHTVPYTHNWLQGEFDRINIIFSTQTEFSNLLLHAL